MAESYPISSILVYLASRLLTLVHCGLHMSSSILQYTLVIKKKIKQVTKKRWPWIIRELFIKRFIYLTTTTLGQSNVKPTKTITENFHRFWFINLNNLLILYFTQVKSYSSFLNIWRNSVHYWFCVSKTTKIFYYN